MDLFSGLKNSLAFLTIVPVGMDKDGWAQAAKYMPTFPLIGALLGAATGAFVWILEFPLPSLIAGFLGLGFLLFLTGVHHTDGLLDFGDAIMFHGSARERLRIMADPQTGAGGLTLGLVVLTSTALCIGTLPQGIVVPGLIASEAASKLAMVLLSSIGKSAHAGLNTPFVKAMHEERGRERLALAFLLFLPAAAMIGVTGVALALSAILVTVCMMIISNRLFRGITGDVLGATNDVARLAALLVVLAVVR